MKKNPNKKQKNQPTKQKQTKPKQEHNRCNIQAMKYPKKYTDMEGKIARPQNKTKTNPPTHTLSRTNLGS